MDLQLTDRVYIVTGASRGLGRATAEVLVQEGARVVVSSRFQDAVDEAVRSLGADCVAGLVADNADPHAPAALIKAARDRFGRLDGALVSVGGPPPGSVMTRSDDEWRTSFESVFLGAVRLCT
ncbi:MAG: SDR family NAD(P)-dependent oxidoreductase, partial [Nocardioidaceae bacterium]|nr:SDR family NAD(P)-dependent oxidoreductase [Nocardioidaceae bacterium]